MESFGHESPFIRYWRPTMAWMYAVICIFDFIVGPIVYMIVQQNATAISQWEPMTLGSAGIFHLAMGAIVAAVGWGRSQEKIRYMDYINHITKVRTKLNTPVEPMFDEMEDEVEEPQEKPTKSRKVIETDESKEPVTVIKKTRGKNPVQ